MHNWQKFGTTIQLHCPNRIRELIYNYTLKLHKQISNLTFIRTKIDPVESRKMISKEYIVAVTIVRGDWRRPPQVTMH
jgi:hypothetical protein